MVDSTRPKRLAALQAVGKIQSVLEWESMSRQHPTYIAVENAINAEFEREGKTKKAKTDAGADIEYDIMSDSSEESTVSTSQDCFYEPCAESVDSAEEEDIRSESSLCSSGIESLPKDDDSDTSIVDFSADGDTADEDSYDEECMYDEDDDDEDEAAEVDEASSVVVETAQPIVISSDVKAHEIVSEHDSDFVISPWTHEIVSEHDSDFVWHSDAECMLTEPVEPADSHEQISLHPDGAYEQDDDGIAMFDKMLPN